MLKRIAAFVAVLLLFASSAFADIDLSGMTLEELIALKQQINLEIALRPEVKAVVVPIGVWEIGKDIPAGHWSMTPEPGHFHDWTSIAYCDVLNETGKNISADAKIWYRHSIKCEGSEDRTIEETFIDLELKDGMFLIVNYCPIIFTPFTGKPDLGFDW